jgi:hypothetical protein
MDFAQGHLYDIGKECDNRGQQQNQERMGIEQRMRTMVERGARSMGLTESTPMYAIKKWMMNDLCGMKHTLTRTPNKSEKECERGHQQELPEFCDKIAAGANGSGDED